MPKLTGIPKMIFPNIPPSIIEELQNEECIENILDGWSFMKI